MPSKSRQLYYLGLSVLGWFLWLPFTGNPRHDRTWGELKRLRPREVAVMLVPLACYAGIGVWVYLFFPRGLYVWAGSVYAIGLLLGGSVIAFTVVTTKIIDWSHVHIDR